jgi:hypothetical protein
MEILLNLLIPIHKFIRKIFGQNGVLQILSMGSIPRSEVNGMIIIFLLFAKMFVVFLYKLPNLKISLRHNSKLCTYSESVFFVV